MRVLVLGGTNFIGPAAVRSLVARGHEVVVFHRGKRNTPLPDSVRHIYGDRAQLADYRSEFESFTPEVVLDMVPCTAKDGHRLLEVFTGLTRRLVAISSSDVYRAYDRLRKADPGPPDPAPLTEDSPLRDILFPYRHRAKGEEDFNYHYEKIVMERTVQSAPDTLPATVLRLPMVYGPGDYQHRLFHYLKRMDDGRPAILLSESEASWHGLRGYVEDIGEAIALCVVSEQAAGRTYHIADREYTTEAEWVARIAKAAGWDGRIVVLPDDRMPSDMQGDYDYTQDWSLDSSRIRAELGYVEPTPPDEAMQQTVLWERENPPKEIDPAAFDYAAEDAALAGA